MLCLQDNYHNVSLRMSQVMDEIGVNEKIVMKRRRSWLLNESIFRLSMNKSVYYFGSQTEGTTTLGLFSDSDCLLSRNECNVIQNWSEWERGKPNYLMIQGQNVSPGYCLLLTCREDAPLPRLFRIRKGFARGFLENTLMFRDNNEFIRHGPALCKQFGPGVFDHDFVPAFPCRSIPAVVLQGLNRHRGHLLTNEMIQYCKDSVCFLVGKGQKGSVNEKLEWRISTSFAERCLMFNLNITQIRCYVLMKMILKEFIFPFFPDSISSYMCKTVLLHCIANTRFDAWRENTLLTCLLYSLSILYNCIQNEYCPHFFIMKNNLMKRQFTPEIKPHLLEALQCVIETKGRVLLKIKCDNFGSSLQSSFDGTLQKLGLSVPTIIAGHLLKNTVMEIGENYNHLLKEMNDLSQRQILNKIFAFLSNRYESNSTNIERRAFRLIAQHLCSTAGSILASFSIYHQNKVTNRALSFMTLGINSDVASGKLKLASVIYCAGEIEKTELILKDIEGCYDVSVVEPVCACHNFLQGQRRERFNTKCYESNKEHTLIKQITASCVRFLRCEINCCPCELQNEMFRSTQDEILNRSIYDTWMDWAVVDSLPYIYFLQYKTYSRLGKQNDKQKALCNLVRTIEYEINLGHRETALNLLGQCMEKEKKLENAFKCYALSLQTRSQNNAAKVHICILLNKLINNLLH